MADVLLAGDAEAVSTSVLAIDLNPISWLGDAASAAVADVWKAAMIALWSAGLWLLTLAFQIIDAFTTPDLSADGPMGAVLTPSLIGVEQGGQLPNASTFCGRCEAVCPMMIPLPKMMRHWREREFERHLQPAAMRYGIGLWGFFARRPALYRLATRAAMGALAFAGRERGRFTWLPFTKGWTKYRDFPAPQGRIYQRDRSGSRPSIGDLTTT